MMNVKERINQLFPQLVEWRRHFHQYPELSFQEKETSEFIASYLQSLGLQLKTNIGGYGLTGLLEGNMPGPTIALRADMDALPIQDEKDCSYRSRVSGVMHACGHDGHMSVLMGAATILKQFQEQINGKIVFLFQPAEEHPPGGAVKMIEDGVLEDVDRIYGIHLWSPLPYGTIGVCSGQMLASADQFEIEIFGRGGHGGLPHEAIDSIVVASQIVVQLQSIISRQIDPLQSGVISIGKIEGGENFNAIADQCRLIGTTRSLDEKIREELLEKIEMVVKSVCQIYGASYQFHVQRGYPPLVNHPKEVERVVQLAKQIVKDQHIVKMRPLMGAEDFAYYLQKIPGMFCMVGAAPQSDQKPHHHPRFDIDERAMKIALELFVQIGLQNGKPTESIDSENVSLSDWLS